MFCRQNRTQIAEFMFFRVGQIFVVGLFLHVKEKSGGRREWSRYKALYNDQLTEVFVWSSMIVSRWLSWYRHWQWSFSIRTTKYKQKIRGTVRRMNELKKKSVRKNTTAVTNTSVNMFKKFCHQVNCSKTLEELTKEELDSLLKRFYDCPRKENGDKMTAFNALRYSLQLHFLELKSWDIKADSSFIECNQIFKTIQSGKLKVTLK